MEIAKFTFNPFQENTFLIWDSTRECVIVDPGCYEKKEEEILLDFIKSNDLHPVKLINTHCHIDHILGNKFTSSKWNLSLNIHKKDLPVLESSMDVAKMYNLHHYQESPHPSNFLEEGEIIRFGDNKLEVLFTPGHSPGHITLFSRKDDFIIGGDVLFNGGIGRTDLPGGDLTTLLQSIKIKLLLLKDSTIVYCGHGASTTIGKERETNPFLQ